MAENVFAKLDHRIPVARAEVRQLTPFDPDAVHVVDRADLHTYSQLSNPDAPSAHGVSPPAPPVPTEQELRGALAQALEAEHIAITAANDAEAAHQRAQRHLERAGCALDLYADVDARMTEATVDMLRQDNGELREHDTLLARMVERDQARTTYAAAASAAELLKREMTTAKEQATEATRKVNNLLAAICAFPALALAERHEQLMAEAAKLRETLHAFNHFIANKHVSMPPLVLKLLGHDTSTLARMRDQSQWKAAADRLRQDPDAIINLTAASVSVS